jgi:hypothetical protein
MSLTRNTARISCSNTLKRVLSKTLKFRPTPNIIEPKIVFRNCDLFGHSLIKTFNRFVCKEYIKQAKINFKLAGIRPWKRQQFPHSTDYYADFNQDYFDTTKPAGFCLVSSRRAMPWTAKLHRIFKAGYCANGSHHSKTRSSDKTESTLEGEKNHTHSAE